MSSTVCTVMHGGPFQHEVLHRLFHDENEARMLAEKLAEEQVVELNEFVNMDVHIERPNRNNFTLVNRHNGRLLEWFVVEKWEVM